MTIARQKLQTKDLPGYRQFWFREENIPAAQAAYYTFVKRGELELNASSTGHDPNTDLGTNVSMIAGQDGGGNPVRLVLMKIKIEYFREDQRALEEKNARIMQAIFGDEAAVGPGGGISALGEHQYVKKERTALFNRKTRKAKLGKRGS
jgi:hypothetical protein